MLHQVTHTWLRQCVSLCHCLIGFVRVCYSTASQETWRCIPVIHIPLQTLIQAKAGSYRTRVSHSHAVHSTLKQTSHTSETQRWEGRGEMLCRSIKIVAEAEQHLLSLLGWLPFVFCFSLWKSLSELSAFEKFPWWQQAGSKQTRRLTFWSVRSKRGAWRSAERGRNRDGTAVTPLRA